MIEVAGTNMNQPKAILLANIGTSDLAVKIDKDDYHYPIGFDRDEPRLQEQLKQLEENKRQAWNQKDEVIATKLCPQLDVQVTIKEDKNTGKISYKFSFRELTKKIIDNYQNWDDKIIPGRIWGVIEEAYHQFHVRTVYIFITDQESPKYNTQDSIYLFEIIKKWFSKRLPDLKFCDKKIPRDKSPVEPDDLLPYYFDTLNEIIQENEQQEVLASIKGGTPQMQNALQIQVMSSAIKKQIFLKPILEVDKVLNGKKSECPRTCYWRSMQKQKFDTVKTLLQKRWDFDGAREIIKDWNETLDFFKENIPNEREAIISDEKSLNKIIEVLTFAVDCFNLDKNTTIEGAYIKRWLNLYTQCRIYYWHLDEIANFLTRLGSFYEEVLQELIRQLDGEKYFKDGNKDNKWVVSNPDKKWLEQDYTNGKWILREYPRKGEQYQIWDELVKLEQKMGGYKVTWRYSSSNEISLKVQGTFKTDERQALEELNNILTANKIRYRDNYKLVSRYMKRNFVQALINIKYQDKEDNWKQIFSSLEKLDYWCDKRNDLIHSAKGMSKESMKKELEEGRKNWTEEDEKDRYKANPHKACEVDNILGEMINVCLNVQKILSQELEADSKYIGYTNNTPYYIYSDVIEKIIQQLN